MIDTIYAPDTLRAINWTVSTARDTDYVAFYAYGCTPPPLPTAVNLRLQHHPSIPAGRVVLVPVGDMKRREMVSVDSISFDDDGAMIAYSDDVPGSAVRIANDERYADEIATLRAHAGILAAQMLRTVHVDAVVES